MTPELFWVMYLVGMIATLTTIVMVVVTTAQEEGEWHGLRVRRVIMGTIFWPLTWLALISGILVDVFTYVLGITWKK